MRGSARSSAAGSSPTSEKGSRSGGDHVGLGRAGPLLATAIPGEEQFRHAHNLWLNWAVETGYLGLAGILGVTVGAAVITVHAIRRGAGVDVAALGAGLAGFAVFSLADHPANAARISVAMWAALGLLAGLVGRARLQREQVEHAAVTTPIPVAARSRAVSRVNEPFP